MERIRNDTGWNGGQREPPRALSCDHGDVKGKALNTCHGIGEGPPEQSFDNDIELTSMTIGAHACGKEPRKSWRETAGKTITFTSLKILSEPAFKRSETAFWGMARRI